MDDAAIQSRLLLIRSFGTPGEQISNILISVDAHSLTVAKPKHRWSLFGLINSWTRERIVIQFEEIRRGEETGQATSKHEMIAAIRQILGLGRPAGNALPIGQAQPAVLVPANAAGGASPTGTPRPAEHSGRLDKAIPRHVPAKRQFDSAIYDAVIDQLGGGVPIPLGGNSTCYRLHQDGQLVVCLGAACTNRQGMYYYGPRPKVHKRARRRCRALHVCLGR